MNQFMGLILEYTKSFAIAIILITTCIFTFKISYTWQENIHLIIHSDGAFWIYVSFLSLFHLLEFICTVPFSYTSSPVEAFLLNHSKEYHLFVIISILEYWIEKEFIYPAIVENINNLKLDDAVNVCSRIVKFVGFIGVIFGQVFRSWAMIYSGSNFTHKIMTRKRPEHVLVTTGPYR